MYKDKILGGLYGQALGDAFGMPAYFDPDDTKRKVGWISDLIPAADDHDVHCNEQVATQTCFSFGLPCKDRCRRRKIFSLQYHMNSTGKYPLVFRHLR